VGEIGDENKRESVSRVDVDGNNIEASVHAMSASDDSAGDMSTVVGDKDVQPLMVVIFVYVWVRPDLRRKGVSDMLLHHSLSCSRARGDQFLLLVHDDYNSGRLVDYHCRTGFVPCEDVVPNGLLVRI